jgi:TP901 family phage tail tape measure protein
MTKGIEFIIEFTDKFSNMAEKYVKSFDFMGKQTAAVNREIGAIPKSIRDLEVELNTLRGARDKAFDVGQIKQYNAQISSLERQIRNVQGMGIDPPTNTTGVQKMLGYVKNLLATLGLVGAVGIALSFGNESIDFAAKISDGMASVAKTTGISDENMLKFRKNLQGIDTRTNLQDLFKIGEIGGQLGIAEKDISGFTKTIDMLGIAFKGEFNSVEETADKLGGLANMFPKLINSGMPVPEIISRIGSGINELSASGKANAPFIADFVSRAAPSLKALNPETLLAFGAAMQESNMTSENAASGIRSFFGYVFKESDKFSKFMKMNANSMLNMLNTDAGTQKFLRDFADKFKGVSDSKAKLMLSDLGVKDFQGQDFIQNLMTRMSIKGTNNPAIDRLQELLEISRVGMAENMSIAREFDKMNNTLAAKLEKQSKKYDDVKLKLGEMLIPFKLQAMELGSGILEKIVNWAGVLESKKGLFESLAVGAAVFGGALALANLPALSLLGTQVLLAVTNPFALTIAGAAAVAGLFAYLYYQSENFRGILWATFEGGKVWFEGFYNVGKTFITGIIDLVKGLADIIVGLFELDIDKMGNGLATAFKGAFKSTIGTTIAGIGEGIDKTPKIFDAMGKGFDAGKADYQKDNRTPDYVSKLMGSRPDDLVKVMGDGNLFGVKVPSTPTNIMQAPKGTTLPNAATNANKVATNPFADLTGGNNDLSNATNKDLVKGLDTVSGGGSKPTTINITIGKLNESIVINTTNLDEGSVDVEGKLTEMLLRVVNGANQQ